MLAGIFMLTANILMAQYAEEALMMSRTRAAGSARILGMGGAQISLGGDMSSAASNPAGLGMFNRSEFSITPGYMSLDNVGTYFMGDVRMNNYQSNDSRTGLSIPAFGMVFSKPKDEQGFIHGTFAITMSKINDFNSNTRYSGTNNDGHSLIEYFLQDANGFFPDEFASGGALRNSPTEMAYNNYLIGPLSDIDPDFPDNQYFTDFEPFLQGRSPQVTQSEVIQTKGGQNQWSFSYGANFDDKFFLGAGLGIVAMNYQSSKFYTETFNNQPLDTYTLREDLQVKGTGLNVTVGGIYRPIDGLQLGASIATPTRYNITDTYKASMTSHWFGWQYDASTTLNNESSEGDDVLTPFTLVTPWKFSAGASYIFGKSGLISVDIERLNYGGSKLRSTDPGFDMDQDTEQVKATYTAVTNIRAGGEYRIKSFRVRGGFGYMPDPYKKPLNDVSIARLSASGGVGYRASKFYIDLAYIKSWNNNSYVPYSLDNPNSPSPVLGISQTATNVVATVGFTF